MKSFTPKTFVMMLLGIAGASIGAVIYLWGTPSTSEGHAFITSPEFITWFFLNEVLFAFYPVLAVMLWEPLTQLRKHLHHNRLEIWGSSILLLGLFIFPQFVGQAFVQLKPLPLAYADTKLLVFMLIGFFASALPLSIGIWLTQAAIRDTFLQSWQAEYDIKDYLRLRDYLQQFLTILGALLSVFTLVSAALRGASLASGAAVESRYPSIYLLIFGAYYTLVLALLYFPAYHSLVSAGQRLRDTYFALPSPRDVDWAETYKRRQELENLLELKLMGAQRFLTSISILSPFVSGIFTLLVKI